MGIRHLYVILLALILMGCTPSQTGGFSIYLLADEIPASELSKVDLHALELQGEPLLSIDDVITYWKGTHEIEVTAEAYERIEQLYSLPVGVDGLPCVVCMGRDPVYAGAFWTLASSLIYEGVVIYQHFDRDAHVIRIELGYPTSEAFRGEDPRSDPRILQSLEAAGKLK